MSETTVYCDKSGQLNKYSNITDVYTSIVVDKSCKILPLHSLSYGWVTNISIPNTILTIEDDAFYDSKITELFIPSSVISINEFNPFNMLRFIKRFIVDSENKFFTSYKDCIFTKDMYKLIAYPRAKQEDTFIVPKETKVIGKQVFGSNYIVKNIILQNDVDLIDSACFSNAIALTRVSLPYGRTIKQYGDIVFNKINFGPSNITYYFGNPGNICQTCKNEYTYRFMDNAIFMCYIII